jgi:hypothetical protein
MTTIGTSNDKISVIKQKLRLLYDNYFSDNKEVMSYLTNITTINDDNFFDKTSKHIWSLKIPYMSYTSGNKDYLFLDGNMVEKGDLAKYKRILNTISIVVYALKHLVDNYSDYRTKYIDITNIEISAAAGTGTLSPPADKLKNSVVINYSIGDTFTVYCNNAEVIPLTSTPKSTLSYDNNAVDDEIKILKNYLLFMLKCKPQNIKRQIYAFYYYIKILNECFNFYYKSEKLIGKTDLDSTSKNMFCRMFNSYYNPQNTTDDNYYYLSQFFSQENDLMTKIKASTLSYKMQGTITSLCPLTIQINTTAASGGDNVYVHGTELISSDTYDVKITAIDSIAGTGLGKAVIDAVNATSTNAAEAKAVATAATAAAISVKDAVIAADINLQNVKSKALAAVDAAIIIAGNTLIRKHAALKVYSEVSKALTSQSLQDIQDAARRAEAIVIDMMKPITDMSSSTPISEIKSNANVIAIATKDILTFKDRSYDIQRFTYDNNNGVYNKLSYITLYAGNDTAAPCDDIYEKISELNDYMIGKTINIEAQSKREKELLKMFYSSGSDLANLNEDITQSKDKINSQVKTYQLQKDSLKYIETRMTVYYVIFVILAIIVLVLFLLDIPQTIKIYISVIVAIILLIMSIINFFFNYNVVESFNVIEKFFALSACSNINASASFADKVDFINKKIPDFTRRIGPLFDLIGLYITKVDAVDMNEKLSKSLRGEKRKFQEHAEIYKYKQQSNVNTLDIMKLDMIQKTGFINLLTINFFVLALVLIFFMIQPLYINIYLTLAIILIIINLLIYYFVIMHPVRTKAKNKYWKKPGKYLLNQLS